MIRSEAPHCLMAVAQKCAKACGPATRKLIKTVADNPAHWSAFLVKNLIGSNRTLYREGINRYADPAVDRPGWEAAAVEAGLRPVHLAYASEGEISPGAQLFLLASTLYGLGLYTTVGEPNGNAGAWKDSITS